MTLSGPVKAWLAADWPAPAHIHGGISTRIEGYSLPPFDRFNLADHVGDIPESVQKNREHLRLILGLAAEPHWLNQTHSNRVVEIQSSVSARDADAAYTTRPDIVCAVLTADCVPVLVCNRAGTEIAVMHAGWRGLCSGIIENTLGFFKSNSRDLLVWIGPHISSSCYEVQDDVRDRCLSAISEDVTAAFTERHSNRWLADLGKIVKIKLSNAGITEVYGCNLCTYLEDGCFYSYRREKKTGRMASLIWIDGEQISYA